jgi:hypothetical protein
MIEDIKRHLEPVTEKLPPGARDFLDAGGWWLVLGAAGLLALLLAWSLLRRLLRALFGRRPARERDWDREFAEDLSACPLPRHGPGERRLSIYNLPVRLRLVVVAPVGADAEVDATAVEKLLDRVVPGLGDVARHDRPRIRVWPPQLSQTGFSSAFHRRTRKPEADGDPSPWVLVAGRADVGRQAVLLGLGLWAGEPNMLGRKSLEPHQWLDVLRVRTAEA